MAEDFEPGQVVDEQEHTPDDEIRLDGAEDAAPPSTSDEQDLADREGGGDLEPLNVMGQDQPQTLPTLEAHMGATDEDRPEHSDPHEPVKVVALHQVIHDGDQKLPGHRFTVPRHQARQMVEARTAVYADDNEDAISHALQHAERERRRSLEMSGVAPAWDDVTAPKIVDNEGPTNKQPAGVVVTAA